MNQIIEFLRSVPTFDVATTDQDNRPRVRPFSLVYEWEGKLSFGTSDAKKVFHQLENNPNVEICAFNPEKGNWIRISGKLKLFKSVEANRYILNEVMPELKNIYGDENNPDMVIASLMEGQADIYSFTSPDAVETIKL